MIDLNKDKKRKQAMEIIKKQVEERKQEMMGTSKKSKTDTFIPTISGMDKLLIMLTHHLLEISSKIDYNLDIKLIKIKKANHCFFEIEERLNKKQVKKSPASVYDVTVDMLNRKENEFASKIAKVYDKYGSTIFEDSLITYLCAVHIIKYLADKYKDEIEELNQTILFDVSDCSYLKDYEHNVPLDEMILGENIGDKIQNFYIDIVPARNSLKTYFIDFMNNLWVINDIENKTANFIEQNFNPLYEMISTNVKFVEVDGENLVGIDVDGRMWTSYIKDQKLIKVYNKIKDEKFIKLTRYNDDVLFGLTESNKIFSIEEISNVFDNKLLTPSKYIDVSSCYDYTLFVSDKNKVFVVGNSYDVGINKNDGNPNLIREIEFESKIKIKKVYAYDKFALMIDVDGNVWRIFKDENVFFGKPQISTPVFEKLNIPEKVKSISKGTEHIIFLTEGGNCYGCGENKTNELGFIGEKITTPTMFNYEEIYMVAAGQFCTFTVDRLSNVKGLGFNNDGRMGIESTETSNQKNLNWIDMTPYKKRP